MPIFIKLIVLLSIHKCIAMSKIIYLIFFFTAIGVNTIAQDIYTIALSPATLELPGRNFYIDEVIDARTQKEYIGIISREYNSEKSELHFSKDPETALLIFFLKSYPRENHQIPLQIKINVLNLSEFSNGNKKQITVKYKVDYLYQNNIIYHDEKLIQTSYKNNDTVFQKNIQMALTASLNDFNNSGWEQKVGIDFSAGRLNESSPEAEVVYSNDYQIYEEEKAENSQSREANFDNRNVLAVGYQIGGMTLIGVNYTFRVSDVMGVHFGGGLAGYTGGLKFHFKPTKKSSFINVSFKDAGFGMMQTVGAEFGGRLVFRKNGNFGFHGQIGLAAITRLEDSFKNQLYGYETEAPPATLTLGVGFSW